jgi:hypothetical protein
VGDMSAGVLRPPAQHGSDERHSKPCYGPGISPQATISSYASALRWMAME